MWKYVDVTNIGLSLRKIIADVFNVKAVTNTKSSSGTTTREFALWWTEVI